MSDTPIVKIDGSRDQEDAEKLVEHLVDSGIRRDAISIEE